MFPLFGRTSHASLRGCRLSCLIAVVALAIPVIHPSAGEIGEELRLALSQRGTHAETAVIVRFEPRLDVQSYFVQDRSRRDNRLMQALRAQQAVYRAQFNPLLDELGGRRIRDLWIINGVSLSLSAHDIPRLAAADGVTRVDLDSHVQGWATKRKPPPRERKAAPVDASRQAVHPQEAHPATGDGIPPNWNIEAIGVPPLWVQGYRGRGIVVASMDTGVDLKHPDLRGNWRGGNNSWYDPHGEEDMPYDAVGHGTQAMGVMVGRRGMGAAPSARWIAARLFDHLGRSRMSDIHLVFQWLMDPDGDPSTLDAPDVVNASWSLRGRVAGSCLMEFSEDIKTLRGAGIAVVFAAGNDGPNRATSSSPGNNPGVLSVGAADRQGSVARQTSRGPSACDASVFPRLLAPGVHVPTTDLSHGGLRSYAEATGSSMAAPHVAGVLALLAEAYPHASVSQLETALIEGGRGENFSGEPVFIDAMGAQQKLRLVPGGQDKLR